MPWRDLPFALVKVKRKGASVASRIQGFLLRLAQMIRGEMTAKAFLPEIIMSRGPDNFATSVGEHVTQRDETQGSHRHGSFFYSGKGLEDTVYF